MRVKKRKGRMLIKDSVTLADARLEIRLRKEKRSEVIVHSITQEMKRTKEDS